VPIVDADNRLVGILTNRDLRFEIDTSQPVSALMTDRNLVTAPIGTTLDEASEILHRNKVEKLPVVDGEGKLRGLITVKDIQKRIEFPQSTKDDRGRLRVGAAIGATGDYLERAQELVGKAQRFGRDAFDRDADHVSRSIELRDHQWGSVQRGSEGDRAQPEGPWQCGHRRGGIRTGRDH